MKFHFSVHAPEECKAGKLLASDWLPPSPLSKIQRQEFFSIKLIVKNVKLHIFNQIILIYDRIIL